MAFIIADVLILRNNKILLVQQRKPSAYELWSFPGGHVETGENIDEAIHREVSEELGLNLIGAKLFTTSIRKTNTGDKFELHTYTGKHRRQHHPARARTSGVWMVYAL